MLPCSDQSRRSVFNKAFSKSAWLCLFALLAAGDYENFTENIILNELQSNIFNIGQRKLLLLFVRQVSFSNTRPVFSKLDRLKALQVALPFLYGSVKLFDISGSCSRISF